VNNWDITANKRFPLFSEERFIQFRTELFNAWNHVRFASMAHGGYVHESRVVHD